MPTARDDLHRLVDELPADVVEAVRKALLATTIQGRQDVQRRIDLVEQLLQSAPGDSPRNLIEARPVAESLRQLAILLREVEWGSPELQRDIADLERTTTAYLANTRWHASSWDEIEAAHQRGEVSDPQLLAFLNAPEDDEPETEDERAAVQEAREAVQRGETRPWDDVRRELEAEAKSG